MSARTPTYCTLTLAAIAALALAVADKAAAGPPDGSKPVKIYILMGQSNMVGMGDISGGSSRWGKEFLDPVVSVYPGPYSATADYDRMTPLATKKLEAFGGVKPTPYPGGGTRVVRGHVQMDQTGIYRFKPGYAASNCNIMEVDGPALQPQRGNLYAGRRGPRPRHGRAVERDGLIAPAVFPPPCDEEQNPVR